MQFEISQSFKNTVLFYLYKVHSIGKSRAESLNKATGGWGKVKMGSFCFMGTKQSYENR